MIKLKDVPFEEFQELVKFLGENKESYIIERISRFFTNLNTEELFDMNHLCSMILSDDQSAKTVYNMYIKTYPDTELDETGKSTASIDISDSWKLSLKSLDAVYLAAEEALKKNKFNDMSPHKINSQVYNGKTLSNLKNHISKSQYSFNKTMYFKKHAETPAINKKRFANAEKILKSFNLSYESLNRLIDIMDIKRPENWETFAEHFLDRLDILAHDSKLEIQSNKEFYDNLAEIK